MPFPAGPLFYPERMNMRRGKQVYGWFPLWSDKWLWGSTRLELSPAERSVWVDLMALANKDDGHIRANETTAYPAEQLAGMFRVPTQVLKSTIEKCLKYNKLIQLENGTLYIKNWDEYSLTNRYKRLISSKEEMASSNVEPKTKNKTETKTENKTENKTQSGGDCTEQKSNEIISLWNGFAARHGLPAITGIAKGSKREGSLRARSADKGFDFRRLLEKIEEQPFLLGENSNGWHITFDWILLPSNYQKIMEGNYKRDAKPRYQGIKKWLDRQEAKDDAKQA